VGDKSPQIDRTVCWFEYFLYIFVAVSPPSRSNSHRACRLPRKSDIATVARLFWLGEVTLYVREGTDHCRGRPPPSASGSIRYCITILNTQIRARGTGSSPAARWEGTPTSSPSYPQLNSQRLRFAGSVPHLAPRAQIRTSVRAS